MTYNSKGSQSRRQFLLNGTKGAAVGSALLAGCVSTEGGSGTETGSGTEFTIASTLLPDENSMEGPQPSGIWKLQKRLNERTDGRIDPSVVAENQICGEGTCPSKLSQDVIEVGASSIGNSTSTWAGNDIWLIPYTFPSNEALAHTLVKEETWEKYWVPLAEKRGVIPFWHMVPHLRNVAIGTDTAGSQEGGFRTPSDIQNLSIRRTQSSVASKAIDQWGANPVNLSWGDTVQGLRSGVVDGAESWNPAFVAFGMASSIDEVILNEWTVGNEVIWADVEWLKGLSTEDRDILAEETKKVHEELARLTHKVNEQRVGATQPPEDGTAFAEEEITVNALNDQEKQKWEKAVKKEENQGLYSDIIKNTSELGIDGEAFYEYLYDSARENAVPSSFDNFTVDAWWNDYIDQIEV